MIFLEYISIKTAINQGFSRIFRIYKRNHKKNQGFKPFFEVLGVGILLSIPTCLIGFNAYSEKSQENQGICEDFMWIFLVDSIFLKCAVFP